MKNTCTPPLRSSRHAVTSALGLCLLALIPAAQAEDMDFGFADLVLTAEPMTVPAKPGELFELRYLVTNEGPLTAYNVRLALDHNENLMGVQMMDCGPRTMEFGPPSCDLERPLAAGESAKIALLGMVPEKARGTVELHAFASSAGSYDPNPKNNVADTYVPIHEVWAD